MAHEAAVYDIDGAGEKIITYVNGKGESSSEAPVAAGDYEVYLEFKEARDYMSGLAEKSALFRYSISTPATGSASVSLRRAKREQRQGSLMACYIRSGVCRAFTGSDYKRGKNKDVESCRQ